jgi:endogenous inhibitor of DNA gyrase (YacG/DUF329 family)
MTAEIIKLKKTVPCPICGKPSSQANHPFCSPRCQDIDLNRWLSGSYVIPARDDEDEAGLPGADGGDDDE